MAVSLLAGTALLLAMFAGVVWCAMVHAYGLVAVGVIALSALVLHAYDVICGWRASRLQVPQVPRARTVRR